MPFAMLRQASERAADAGVVLDLREGDMRPHVRTRCGVAAPERTLRLRTPWIRSSHRSPAGGQRQDDPVPHTNRYAVDDNRIDITLDDGGTSSLWWGTKNDWLGLLDVAGLELEGLGYLR